MKKIAYVGPSWAVRSFDNSSGYETDLNGGTNLIKEMGLLNEPGLEITSLARLAATNIGCLNSILYENQDTKFDGIIWVYCGIISDLIHFLPISKKELFKSENFWQIREELNQRILSKINDLNIPVALIGAHSDVVNCDYPNITVIHPSWQKFLGNDLRCGWEAEVAHREIIEINVTETNFKPSKSVVNLIVDTLGDWHNLEMLGVFNNVHPNRKGNELFAKEIKPSVYSFINNL